jgi:hypothetical protein
MIIILAGCLCTVHSMVNVSNRPLTDRRAFLLESLQCSG